VQVSVLFNEPKLLKFVHIAPVRARLRSFSALQRAEIAEILAAEATRRQTACFSALQRAEIAEISVFATGLATGVCFSALQRAEIAEIGLQRDGTGDARRVSVLFNEPKLLKCWLRDNIPNRHPVFQCSSTSRNC